MCFSSCNLLESLCQHALGITSTFVSQGLISSFLKNIHSCGALKFVKSLFFIAVNSLDLSQIPLPCKASYGYFTGEVTGTQERLNFA